MRRRRNLELAGLFVGLITAIVVFAWAFPHQTHSTDVTHKTTITVPTTTLPPPPPPATTTTPVPGGGGAPTETTTVRATFQTSATSTLAQLSAWGSFIGGVAGGLGLFVNVRNRRRDRASSPGD